MLTLQQRVRAWVAVFLAALVFLAVLPLDARAVVWPGQVGYTGGAYALWIYDGTNLAVTAENDIVQVDLARDSTPTNNFFFFKFLLRAQRNSQLTSVAHVAYIDTNGDGIYDYALYNTTQGDSESELTRWDTSSTPHAWSDTPSPPAHVYSGYTRDASSADNYIELAVPADDLGNPTVLLQAAAAGQGALNLDGNTSNVPSPSDFGDITEPRASEPMVHASNIVFTAVSTGSVALAWQNGSGSRRIVVAGTRAVSWSPSDFVTYPANADFALGTSVGSGFKVVFNGSGTNLSVVGLTPATAYHFTIFEYNGVASVENYYTAPTPASASIQTRAPEVLLRITDMRLRDGVIVLSWSSAEGGVYAIEEASRLSGPFLSVSAGLGATPPVNTFACPLGADGEPSYYRVIGTGP